MQDLGGLNPHHAVAGFGGALAALPFMKPANWLMACGMIITGLATAMYMTPVFAEVLASPKLLGAALSPRAELGLGFLLGLTAMILVPAILGMATWIKDNVTRLMERITGVAKDGGSNV